MKKLLVIFVLTLCYSCTDIINTGNNVYKEPAPTVPQFTDSLSYLAFSTQDLGDIKKGRIKNAHISMGNQSDNMTINIYSLRFINNAGFELNSLNGYPIAIAPGSTNAASPVIITFNTNNYPEGSYEDYIIINDNPNYKIKVIAKIHN